jgi:hypothetical protein
MSIPSPILRPAARPAIALALAVATAVTLPAPPGHAAPATRTAPGSVTPAQCRSGGGIPVRIRHICRGGTYDGQQLS